MLKIKQSGSQRLEWEKRQRMGQVRFSPHPVCKERDLGFLSSHEGDRPVLRWARGVKGRRKGQASWERGRT